MKRKTDNFSKFYTKKNNAAIKEAFKQEKKAEKKARKEGIERHFEEKRQARAAQFSAGQTAEEAQASLKKLTGKKKPPTLGMASASGDAKNRSGTPVAVPVPKGPAPNDPHALPLNKYIAHGGICSRRDAAELIRQGKVQVNGLLVTEPGTKVAPEDIVNVNGKKITISRNFVYILLNKPKDYITTTDDPQGRKTVLDLIRQATTERVYPVGRLDRNTSGVLLLTNDGDLAQKLAHPKHEIKKIYHVTLDKPLTKTDFDKIVTGVELEDGLAHVDVLAYADPKDKTQVGLEIHSGRNRIVRRIFEQLGYDVRGLDRVTYAGLTKKNVQRGHWRLLSEKEIRILKYLNSSFRGSLSNPKSQAKAKLQQEAADEAEAAEIAVSLQKSNGPLAAPAKVSKAVVPVQRKGTSNPAKTENFDGENDFNEPKRKASHNITGTGYKPGSSSGPRKPKYAGPSRGEEKPKYAGPSKGRGFGGPKRKEFGESKGKTFGESKGKSFGEGKNFKESKRKDFGASKGKNFGPSKRKDFGELKGKDFGESGKKDFGESKSKSFGAAKGKDFGDSKSKSFGASKRKDFSESKGKDFGESKGKNFGESKRKDFRPSKSRDFSAEKPKHSGSSKSSHRSPASGARRPAGPSKRPGRNPR